MCQAAIESEPRVPPLNITVTLNTASEGRRRRRGKRAVHTNVHSRSLRRTQEYDVRGDLFNRQNFGELVKHLLKNLLGALQQRYLGILLTQRR